MGKEKFPDRDVDSDVAKKAGGLQVLTPPTGLKFKVEVVTDAKLEKEAGKDPLLKAEMWEKVNAVYDNLVDRIADNLRKTDRGAVKLRDSNQLDKMNKLVDVVNRGIVSATRLAETQAKKAVLAHWEELCKTHKEYRNYKIKIVATIVGAAAGLIASISIMAATPFSGGASAAFGIIGMVKSTVVIGKEIISAAMTVTKSIKGLEVQVKVVEKLWEKSKAGGHAHEVTQTIFENFVGQSASSVKSCISNLSTAKNKLKGVQVKNHSLAKNLQKILDKTDEMRAGIVGEAKKRLQKHPSPKAINDLPKIRKNLDELLEPYEVKIAVCLTAIQENNLTIKAAIIELRPLEERVKALAKMRDLKAYTVLDNLLTLSSLALSALNGNGLVSGTGSIIENVVPAATSFAYDKIVGKAIDGTFLA